MEIISSENMDSCYRLYSHNSKFVRVQVTPIDAESGLFALRAQITDEEGTHEGFKGRGVSINIASDQADVSPFSDRDELPSTGTKGDLVRINGRLYEHEGGEWVDRGPISAGASAEVAEAIAAWDRVARGMVVSVIRSGMRAGAGSELTALIE